VRRCGGCRARRGGSGGGAAADALSGAAAAERWARARDALRARRGRLPRRWPRGAGRRERRAWQPVTVTAVAGHPPPPARWRCHRTAAPGLLQPALADHLAAPAVFLSWGLADGPAYAIVLAADPAAVPLDAGGSAGAAPAGAAPAGAVLAGAAAPEAGAEASDGAAPRRQRAAPRARGCARGTRRLGGPLWEVEGKERLLSLPKVIQGPLDEELRMQIVDGS
jgi:hypothetical protein